MKKDINSLLSNAFKYSVDESFEPSGWDTNGDDDDDDADEEGIDEDGVGTWGITLLIVVFCLFGVSWKPRNCWYFNIVAAVGMTVEYFIDFKDCLVDNNNLRDIFFWDW